MTETFTKRFRTIKTPEGFKFQFFCDLCDQCVETPEIKNESYEIALNEAQEYARKFFNMCHECGKWICDEHYNEDEMKCVDCSPKENRSKPSVSISTQKKCPACGHINQNGDCFCHNCGKAI